MLARLDVRWATLAASGLTCALVSIGCGEGELPRCVTVDAACTPRYMPSFVNIYENTMRQGCGSQSAVCHSAAGRKGGLSLESPSVAYSELVRGGRVIPGDAACSELVVRLHGGGASYAMPPGAQLAAADRCAVEQWIAAGAPEPLPGPVLQLEGAP